MPGVWSSEPDGQVSCVDEQGSLEPGLTLNVGSLGAPMEFRRSFIEHK